MTSTDTQEEWIDLDMNHDIVEPLALEPSVLEPSALESSVLQPLAHFTISDTSDIIPPTICPKPVLPIIFTEEHILSQDSDVTAFNPFDGNQAQQSQKNHAQEDDTSILSTTPLSRYDSDECIVGSITSSIVSSIVHATRKKKQSMESWQRLLYQSLSVYQLLGKSLGSGKKKEQLVESVMHTIQENHQFDRVGRLHILHDLMLELKDTVLDENQKKNIIIQLFDIMIDAIVEDVTWYNDCRHWLQHEALPTMDFLYQVHLEKYQPSPFWKFINK